MRQPSRAQVLLLGRPGTEGFRYHDGYNQPIHQAAPGVLGLLEGRRVVERWKPAIVQWMDEAGHFFSHIEHEFAGERRFDPVSIEVGLIREMDAPPPVKNRFLFDYLQVLAGELEQSRVATRGGARPPVRLRSSDTDVSLDGAWTAYYRRGPGTYVEREMQLPVNWELVPGIENYAGSMRFTRTLHVPEAVAGQSVYLSFLGVDYYADLWVNGHYVGGHEGFFAPFAFDVSPFLHYGELNVVRLAVAAPNDPAGEGVHVASGWDDFRPQSSFPNRKTLVKGTLGHHDAKRGGAWSSLTSQDGNTGGVWADVVVRVRKPVHFALTGPRVTTVALAEAPGDGDFTASVEMGFPVHNATHHPVPARLRVGVEPANFDGEGFELVTDAELRPGTSWVVLPRADLAPVRPWQPWDHGLPHLYTVSAALELEGRRLDEVALETGFRTLSVSPIGESTGPDGALVVNGAPVFVRGTNLLPTYWLSEYTDERVDADFRMLREAGFNAVLVHNLVGPKRLYERANRHGVLVVQMFPLQWSYEQSLDLVDRAIHQVRELATLLYNEPAVVSYETHNEPDMRTAEGLDNRIFDFQLHAAFREADPHRWATTFSGGNHAYPGQFYPLRDDNSFATLPARFEEGHFHGRSISRHRNLPAEFGIQAMPHVELFEELLGEERVNDVVERIRTDPKWLAAGAESWEEAQKTIAQAKDMLGDGTWKGALDALDWRLLSRMGQLADEIERIADGSPDSATDAEAQLVSRKLALLLLDVLHYGAFKGENFWFGLWRPAATLPDWVQASQDRQYRLHKEAIETFLAAGVTGPIVGYFSFMFRDADWQAPTWGVVDAAWVPKKAYRAYVESNQPVRVTLPRVLRCPVRLPGDPWLGAEPSPGRRRQEPWADAPVIVANDGSRPVREGRVEIWLEDPKGKTLPLADGEGNQAGAVRFAVDVEPGRGFSYAQRHPDAYTDARPSRWVVPEGLAAGTYRLKARISTALDGTLSTNSYEVVVPDTSFGELAAMSAEQVASLLDGSAGSAGFHYWKDGEVAYRAAPGVRGFLAGVAHARALGIDLYETTQGEHFFRHILAELDALDGGAALADSIWRIRSEILSPAEKTAVLMRYLGIFGARAQRHLAQKGPTPAPGPGASPAGGRPGARPRPGSRGTPPARGRPPARAPVGRDLVPFEQPPQTDEKRRAR